MSQFALKSRFLMFTGLLGACSVLQAQSAYRVYVTNEDSNNVSVIDGATHRVINTIAIGKRPRGLKVSPDGSRLFVAVSGAPKCPPTMDDEDCEKLEVDLSADGIAEVDTASGTVTRILPSGLDPEQFDINWATGMMYIANENANLASLVDTASGTLVKELPTGLEPEGVRMAPDASVVYVTGEVQSDITVIDTATNTVATTIAVGLRPRDIVFSTDSRRAYISNEIGASISVIDVAANAVVNTIALPEGSLPMGVVLSPDNSTLYVANGRARTVVAVDLGTNQVTHSVEAGARPWGLWLLGRGCVNFRSACISNFFWWFHRAQCNFLGTRRQSCRARRQLEAGCEGGRVQVGVIRLGERSFGANGPNRRASRSRAGTRRTLGSLRRAG